MSILDKLAKAYPRLSGFIGREALRRKTSLWQDILFCVAITLAASFYCFEQYQPKMDLMRSLLAILLPLIWLGTAIANGIRQRYGFLAFQVLYWLVPQGMILWNAHFVEIGGYSKGTDIMDIVAKLLVTYPLSTLSAQLDGISEMKLALFLAVGCTVLFSLAGNISHGLVAHKENESHRME